MRVTRALGNLLRTAWQDPLWALTAVVTMPFLAFWLVISGAALVLLVGFAGIGVFALMVALSWRMLTRTLLTHFADLEEDANGSARFTLRKELGNLRGAGLLP